jgi:hypothetical protein
VLDELDALGDRRLANGRTLKAVTKRLVVQLYALIQASAERTTPSLRLAAWRPPPQATPASRGSTKPCSLSPQPKAKSPKRRWATSSASSKDTARRRKLDELVERLKLLNPNAAGAT